MPTERKLTIIAQDPSVKGPDGKILKSQVSIPCEKVGRGPRGYRVHVADYDASQRVLYTGLDLPEDGDPYDDATDTTLLNDPKFHCQNVYAIVMRLLARFEKALGRRVSWSFGGHQVHIAPHAFGGMNAYYADSHRGLFFGYFPGRDGRSVFTCLSHDVVTHEATHALLDGLRPSYTFPSHPDQDGFHEGFSDIVALLSVFGLRDVVAALLPGKTPGSDRILTNKLNERELRESILLGLAEQFGQEASRYRADCLRRAVKRPPRKNARDDFDFYESHKRGEILSAAVLNAFIAVWVARLKSWLPQMDETVPRERVVEDGADAADHLLTMCIRALDYCPVVDITFPDFLSALLTADMELLRDDGKYKYRDALRKQFGRWGIEPASKTEDRPANGPATELGMWPKQPSDVVLDYDCIHCEPLKRNLNEVFRFLWENRQPLSLYEDAYTWVISVRPCIRVAPDGFVLLETVGEYRSVLNLEARQLPSVSDGMEKPDGMPDDAGVCLHGGGVLVFDEFGHLKYHIPSGIDDPERQNPRLKYLFDNNVCDSRGRYGFKDSAPRGQRFALLHARRDGRTERRGEWG